MSRAWTRLSPALVCLGVWLCTSPAAALSPGDPDPNFGAGGTAFYPLGGGASPSSQINAVALQPDGKILIAGRATDSNGNPAFMVTRLLPGGSLDQSFGDGGTVLKQFGAGATPVSEANAIAIQPDGQIVAGGDVLNSDNRNQLLLVRLSGVNGSFDSSFGDLGVVKSLVTWGSSSLFAGVQSLALQPDGGIIAGGFGFEDGPVLGLVVRFNTNGIPDSAFGDNSSTEVVGPSPAGRHAVWWVQAVALQPDGEIIAAGTGDDDGNGQVLVSRLGGETGAFDNSFGDGGLFRDQPFSGDEGHGSGVSGVVVQPDGKIVAAGGASGSGHPDAPALAVRLTGAHGGLDPSFGSGGLVLEDLGSGPHPTANAAALALQPDGNLVLGGTASDRNGNNQLLVARLQGSDGSLDTSFGDGGKVLTQLAPGSTGSSEVRALALQPDGGIVAAGRAGSAAMVTRLIGRAPTSDGGGPTNGGGGGGNQLGQNLVATLSSLGISPATFAAADHGPSIAKTVGAQVSYENSQAATTMLTVLKRTRGVHYKGRCMRRARHRHGGACTRWVAVGRFTHADKVGLNSFHFTGRVYNRKLKPGSYRLRARPRFAGPAGKAIEVNFRIVR